jgi:hypothetical protein
MILVKVAVHKKAEHAAVIGGQLSGEPQWSDWKRLQVVHIYFTHLVTVLEASFYKRMRNTRLSTPQEPFQGL